MRLEALADDAGDPHRGIDAAGGDQRRRGGFQHVPEDVLDRGLAIGAGDADDERIEPRQRRVRLLPVAPLHPRFERREQEAGGNQRERDQLDGDDPPHDHFARQRDGDPD